MTVFKFPSISNAKIKAIGKILAQNNSELIQCKIEETETKSTEIVLLDPLSLSLEPETDKQIKCNSIKKIENKRNEFTIDIDDFDLIKGQGPKAAIERRISELKEEKLQILNRLNKDTNF